MNPTLALWLTRAGLFLAIIGATAGITWFAADAHYSKQYEDLKAQYAQTSKDQAAEDAATLTRYAQAAQEVNEDAKTELASAAASAADLGVRLNDGYAAIRACSATSAVSPAPAVGSAVAADARQPAADQGRTGPEVSAGIDPEVLRDTLTTAIDAINAELLWRQYARQTGQVAQ